MSLQSIDPDTLAFRNRQLALFRTSVLKQAKWRALLSATDGMSPATALDLGSDNGVISHLFRERGGEWWSADLTDETVDAIRRMVDQRVERLTGAELPYADEKFDLIVVVDLLEHLVDDVTLARELSRCLRPGGRLVLNVPHAKRGALLPPVRHALGLTDGWHGHVRPGYTIGSLRKLLPPELEIREIRSYSRFFSHLLDTALNWVYLRGSRGRTRSTAKGMVVTGDSAGMSGGGGKALRAAYPVMRVFAALDALIPWTRGYMLLVVAEKSARGEGTAQDVPSTR